MTDKNECTWCEGFGWTFVGGSKKIDCEYCDGTGVDGEILNKVSRRVIK